jgi:H+/Cl- antiporter ClcA
MMTMLLTMVSYVAVLRDGTLSSEGTNEIQSSVPQVLIVLGILVLFLLLAGTVFWRVRRSSRTPTK